MMRLIFLWMVFLAGACAADVTKLLQQGDALDGKNQTKQALQLYMEADKASPNNPEVLWRLAKEYGLSMSDVSDKAVKLDYGAKALDCAKRAVAADPKNARAQLSLSISYGRLAELMDNKTKLSYAGLIKEHAERSVALDPKNDLGYHVLGAWNYEMAKIGTVVRALARAMYGEIPQGSNADAIRYLEKAAALNPNRMGNHVELGRAYLAAGKKEKAKAQFQKALAMPDREKDDAVARQRARDALSEI